MESLPDFFCNHAPHAQWIIFGLLLLTGLNVPLSEELLILAGGAVASTCLPDTKDKIELFIFVYLGCWMSAWESYWIGRKLGPKLYDIKWFSKVLTPSRIAKLHYYYERFGIITFIVGRFCPGGVRNSLFMTSGLAKMPFKTFVLRDGFACLLATSAYFYLGYLFGGSSNVILQYFKQYTFVFLIIMPIIIYTYIKNTYSRK